MIAIASNKVYPANLMNSNQKKTLAIKSLNKEGTITNLAKQNKVSRQFIHAQKNKLIEAAEQVFSPKAQDDKVLFHLPVTKAWLEQYVISLVLDCRACFRGVIKSMKNLLDYSMSIGNISNIVKSAIQKAIAINATQDLSNVTLGAHDELFHQNKPVLAGIDIPSLYCYLLSQENHRDGDTWGVHLLDLEKQGFAPERVFGDGADGLYAGHKEALPHIPFHLDNFHLTKSLIELRRFFRNRLKTATSYHLGIMQKMEKAKLSGNPQQHAKKLGLAKKEEEKMRSLSSTIDILVSWMQHDILNKAGPNPVIRKELYDFIVSEFKNLEAIHPHRIKEIRIALENQGPLQLAFVDVLNDKFKLIAEKHEHPLEKIWELCELQRCQHSGDAYAIRSLPLQDYFQNDFDKVEDAVLHALDSTERTSSMIENLNSRLSPYLFLRREINGTALSTNSI